MFAAFYYALKEVIYQNMFIIKGGVNVVVNGGGTRYERPRYQRTEGWD